MLAALLHPDRRPRMEPLQLKPGDWLQIILLAMVWGLSFFLTEICLRDLHPLTVAAGRVTSRRRSHGGRPAGRPAPSRRHSRLGAAGAAGPHQQRPALFSYNVGADRKSTRLNSSH